MSPRPRKTETTGEAVEARERKLAADRARMDARGVMAYVDPDAKRAIVAAADRHGLSLSRYAARVLEGHARELEREARFDRERRAHRFGWDQNDVQPVDPPADTSPMRRDDPFAGYDLDQLYRRAARSPGSVRDALAERIAAETGLPLADVVDAIARVT